MAERERVTYSDPGPETHMTRFEQEPSREENEKQVKKVIDDILAKKPFSVVIFAEFETGIVTGAVGSPVTLANLIRIGRLQVQDMLNRSGSIGENG